MTNADGPLTLAALKLDPDAAIAEIGELLPEIVFRRLRKRGVVVAVSGGIDSSVAAALSARALGPERVLALLLPESESSDDTLDLSRMLVEHLRDRGRHRGHHADARGGRLLPAPRRGDPGGRPRVRRGLAGEDRPAERARHEPAPDLLRGGRVSGRRAEPRRRLTSDAYRAVVAATNFKQRTRKMLEYYHADRLNYAVVGTPNRLEYDQGFFVKDGDGAADVKPIAHLYKTQVYQLAEHLGVPEEIRSRPPTTDTYSLPQTQEEFYFSLPYQVLDLCLYALNNGVAAASVAGAAGLREEDVERVFRDIEAKRRATSYLHEHAAARGARPRDRGTVSPFVVACSRR